MLKIKSDIDLKELEKYGFKRKFDENTGELWKYQCLHFQFVYVVIRTRELNLSISYLDNENEEEFYNLIFDLIKDGLVEKMED